MNQNQNANNNNNDNQLSLLKAENLSLQDEISLLKIQLQGASKVQVNDKYLNKNNNKDPSNNKYSMPINASDISHEELTKQNKIPVTEQTTSEEKVDENKSKNNNQFKCQKCKKNRKVDEDTFIFSKCQHKVCRKCVQQHFEKALKKSKWPIGCIICNEQCDPMDFQLFGNDIHQKYCKLEHNETLKQQTMGCPKCNKESSYAEWNKKKNSKRDLWNCPKCKYKMCGKCGIDYDDVHDKLSCEDASKIIRKPRKYMKCSRCAKLLRNATYDNLHNTNGGQYDFIVFCQACKHFNCFACQQVSDNYDIAQSHKRIHQKDAKRSYRSILVVPSFSDVKTVLNQVVGDITGIGGAFSQGYDNDGYNAGDQYGRNGGNNNNNNANNPYNTGGFYNKF